MAYRPADGLAGALAADLDGEAKDLRLVPRVLPLARAAVAGSRLGSRIGSSVTSTHPAASPKTATISWSAAAGA